ncbi:hypothetical protein NB037_15915 [Rathayibacter sp. ZW T2_19]|uniref:Uncharacterized protein n=1 Tax=Rathayibacter rubneri TaxID=2950106 RepID=A0A9X2IVS3_9MICO|nr:hypothetical protein [Rathayibacter rubneri]MCM6763904.1 hypothetical protein [Rathayibacter rubneri]
MARAEAAPATSRAARPAAITRRAAAHRRERVSSRSASTVSTVSASTPASPGHQASRGDGQLDTARAIDAIHQVGTAARRIATSAADGHSGASRQPTSPSPVASGAAGSASRFARIP